MMLLFLGLISKLCTFPSGVEQSRDRSGYSGIFSRNETSEEQIITSREHPRERKQEQYEAVGGEKPKAPRLRRTQTRRQTAPPLRKPWS